MENHGQFRKTFRKQKSMPWETRAWQTEELREIQVKFGFWFGQLSK
jgi:hypothetical protein